MSESTLVTDALRRVRRTSGVSLAFAGMVKPAVGTRQRSVRLEHFVGNTIGALAGVSVDVGHGLGGKVVSVSRPVAVDDYLRTPNITHRYNTIIATEGLRAMAAAPVIVDRTPVAVLYGALHTDDPIGNRTLDVLAMEARALEQQIVATRAAVESAAAVPEVSALRDRITDAYARLRVLAQNVDDPAFTRELSLITESLIDSTAGPGATLTRRERDVLSLAALGYSNARIAETIGVGVQTAKGYMKDAMRKLGASTRLEAVVIARRAGVLPG
ncbi:LuxR family transcriptional regulator [Streptomyces sp. SID6673]|nr:LuxR family transcriptional regulator [Streptomyces sp. SID11726]NEB26695.1 LuxR family transcriptional regulator [Streptomyces sp. SID6673]